MNLEQFYSRQKSVLLIGGAIFFLMCLFPPWLYTIDAPSLHAEKPASYGFLFWPPKPEKEGSAFGVRIDWSRLSLQSFILMLAIGILSLVGKKPEKVHLAMFNLKKKARFFRLALLLLALFATIYMAVKVRTESGTASHHKAASADVNKDPFAGDWEPIKR